MTPAILIDIDGTLANIDHRLHFWHSKDYDAFDAAMHLDVPNSWCMTLIEKFKIDHKIFLITGRLGKHRAITQSWLIKHNIFHNGLLMLKPDDQRYLRDDIIKQELYNMYIRGIFSVSFIVDDRVHIVEMWRSMGLVCLACTRGDY